MLRTTNAINDTENMFRKNFLLAANIVQLKDNKST